MTNLPNTYEEFVWNFVSTLPRGFKQLDIDTDTCRENSIKGGQRSTRSSIQKVLIALCKSRLPRDFCLHEEDKTRLTEILSVVMCDNFGNLDYFTLFNTMFISQDVTYCLTEFGYSQGRTIFKSWGGRHQSDSSLLPLKARGPVVKSCIAFTFQRYRHSCPRYHYLGFQPCSSWLWKGETEKMILAESSRNWRQLKKSAHWISFIHRECLFLSFFKKDKVCWKAFIKTRNFV